jgi:hypothetical protein
MMKTFTKSLFGAMLVALLAGSAQAVVESSYLQWPENGTEQPNGGDLTVYSRVLKTGCTGVCDTLGTECADLTYTFYYRAQGATEYSTAPLTLNTGDCYTPEDEYSALIPFEALTGDTVFFYAEYGDLDGNIDFTSRPGSEQFTFTAAEPAFYLLQDATSAEFTLHVTGDFHCVQPSGQGPGISGTFNGWTYEPMTPSGNGIYTYDMVIPANSAPIVQFKFRNGTDWETLADGPFANREYEILPGSFEDDYAGFWNNEAECPCEEVELASNQMVIFAVDMNYQDPASYAGGVSVQGSREPLNWNAGENLMSDVDGDGVYTLMLTFPAGSINSTDFKFTKSADGTTWEWENSIGNRFLCMPDNGFLALPTELFDDYEPAPGTTVDVEATFIADLSCMDPALYEGGVSLQGMNAPLDNNEGSTPMTGTDGVFEVTVTFPAGTPFNVEYKFARYDLATADWVWEWDGDFTNRQLTISDAEPVITVGPILWEDYICPAEVSISYAAGQVTLDWTAVPGASSYNVYSDADCYGLFENLAGSTANTTITLPAASDACYRVTAVVE